MHIQDKSGLLQMEAHRTTRNGSRTAPLVFLSFYHPGQRVPSPVATPLLSKQ
jgi:hypothetical protein